MSSLRQSLLKQLNRFIGEPVGWHVVDDKRKCEMFLLYSKIHYEGGMGR